MKVLSFKDTAGYALPENKGWYVPMVIHMVLCVWYGIVPYNSLCIAYLHKSTVSWLVVGT